MKILSNKEKFQLIQNTLGKKLQGVTAAPPTPSYPALSKPSSAEIPQKHYRFELNPAYQQIQIINKGAQQLGVENPFFRVHDGNAGATTSIQNKTLINFASYNYLGLSGHPQVNQAAHDAVERYGTSVSASRLVAGERPVHRELERAIADLYQVDDAVVFVSGHATNVSTIGHLFGPKDLVLHDEFIHNSILVGIQLSGAKRMPFPHNDLNSLKKILREARGAYEKVLIAVEGLYSMDGDYPDLPTLIEIRNEHKCFLMVDEAHSLGVMGATGKGLREHFSCNAGDVDIWMGTLSKSFAGCGGFIAGCSALIEQLKFLAPGFIYSVGIPAQVAAPALEALRIMLAEPERVQRLQKLSGFFLSEAKTRGFDTGLSQGFAIIPIITGSSLSAAQLSDRLLHRGINVQPIIYPAVAEKSARLRFFVTSEHTGEQIVETLDALSEELQTINGPPQI